jgi:hypothetical protein
MDVKKVIEQLGPELGNALPALHVYNGYRCFREERESQSF